MDTLVQFKLGVDKSKEELKTRKLGKVRSSFDDRIKFYPADLKIPKNIGQGKRGQNMGQSSQLSQTKQYIKIDLCR